MPVKLRFGNGKTWRVPRHRRTGTPPSVGATPPEHPKPEGAPVGTAGLSCGRLRRSSIVSRKSSGSSENFADTRLEPATP